MPATVVDVEPRVYSPRTGDRIRLVDAVENFLNRSGRGVVRIVGNSLEVNSAIQRLKVQFGDAVSNGVGWDAAEVAVLANELVILVSINELVTEDLKLAVAPWDDDDVIDYLLVHHRAFCGAVSERVRQSDPIWRPSTSVGWRQALSTLAFHPELAGLLQAIRFIVDSQAHSEPERESQCAAASVALTICLSAVSEDNSSIPPRIGAWFGIDAAYLQCMALDYWATCIERRYIPPTIRLGLSTRLIPHLAAEIQRRKVDYSYLLKPTLYRTSFQPIAATILARLDAQWRPMERAWTFFKEANFAKVAWHDWKFSGAKDQLITFDRANFTDADLRQSELAHLSFRAAEMIGVNLQSAILQECDLRNVNLANANLELLQLVLCDAPDAALRRADLRSASFATVNLQHANLDEAMLDSAHFDEVVFSGSSFQDANLEAAIFRRCALSQCDLRTAKLNFARFHACRMTRCNLENVEAKEIDFSSSNLERAWLTGSVFKNANLQKVNLHGAGLGDIDWEGADLRGADLTNVTFHFGSTRSGLVDSPYPSHGTRTDFYTDDFLDQPFKAPEEIRKANLRGADLRGAHLEKTDFYLVDLRGAIFDENYYAHLRKCGAILK